MRSRVPTTYLHLTLLTRPEHDLCRRSQVLRICWASSTRTCAASSRELNLRTSERLKGRASPFPLPAFSSATQGRAPPFLHKEGKAIPSHSTAERLMGSLSASFSLLPLHKEGKAKGYSRAVERKGYSFSLLPQKGSALPSLSKSPKRAEGRSVGLTSIEHRAGRGRGRDYSPQKSRFPFNQRAERQFRRVARGQLEVSPPPQPHQAGSAPSAKSTIFIRL